MSIAKIIHSKKEEKTEFIVVLIFILIGVSLRLIPHLPNFAPVAAIALFGGVYLRKKIAFTIPLAVMIISDIFIGYYELGLMISVYFSFILVTILGLWLKRHKKWYNIGGSAILSAILFFLITNFAVWKFTPWYPKTAYGLTQCYLMALPFFKNTLFGNLFYTFCFFGAYELVKIWIKERFKVSEKNSI